MGSSDTVADLDRSQGSAILNPAPEATKGRTRGTRSSTLCLNTKQLRQRDDLCAINGVVYDLASLAPLHPGGDIVRASGGSDCSALFHSMHPGRDPLKSNLLQAQRIGVHMPEAGEFPKLPSYDFNSPFAVDLRTRVRKVMGSTSSFAPPFYWARTVFILFFTALAELSWIFSGRLVVGLAVGVLHAMIGLSVQHDASHGAISRHGWVNALFAYGADVIGNSRWIWFQQHVLWHHPYTNDIALDEDAVSAEPALFFHDHTKDSRGRRFRAGWWHQFQHLYMHAVLALYGPSITLNAGYLWNLRHNSKMPNSMFEKGAFFARDKPLAWALRCLYFMRVAVLPWYFSGVSLVVGTFLVSTVCGAILTLLFVVSHNFEGSDRVPCKEQIECKEQAESKGRPDVVKVDWYKAQVETACTYGGWAAMVLTGGLNLQIEHHCFPRMSSWHYPRIQRTVRECCEDHGVKYTYYPSLISNLRSTWQYMQTVGLAQVLHEARED